MASNPEDDFLQYEPAPEGAYRELGIGALQGATTDLGGSFADIGALTTGLASKIDPRLLAMSPTASALAAADPAMQDVAAEYGSEALGSRFFPAVPEGLEGYRDLGRLAGGVTGAGEAITARGSRALLGGIQDFMQYLPNVRPQAVTPDGQIIPLPDDALPDTSVTEMLASADTPGINPKYAKDIKKAESLAAKRLEDGEDPRKVFEETGFMRINVDARPGREAGDAPLETKMVFDIPDNLTQINLGGLLPESVASKVSSGESGKKVMDAFEKLKDPKNYFVEEFHRGGKYGRSVKFKLNQVLSKDHPLFDVFPELGEEIDVRIIEKPMKGSGGHWDNTTNTIAIGAKYLGNDRYTSTLFVHELAHVLQTRGDLPRGSSPFLVKESVPNKILDNFMLFQSTEALAEPNHKNFNPFEFFHELRPKGDAKLLENIVEQARFNVKNADPSAPDNLARMWPGNLNSTARINLDEMPYRNEVLAEMRRLIGKREEKAFKEAEAYQALGIDVYRDKDASGSLRQGPSAQANYMKTRGEFMARLQEAYALATEGKPVGERRKLFPMDAAIRGARATEAAPGGDTGAALEYVKEIQPGIGVMHGTRKMDYPAYLAEIREKEALIASNPKFPLKTRFGTFDDMKELELSLEMAKEGDPSAVTIPEGRPSIDQGTVPPSEMGLVDVEGLINVDKIPEDLKKKIEYPSSAPAPALAPEALGESIGGQAIIPTMPNRFFFEDLDMSELTLRPSLDLKGNKIPNSVDIELIRAGKKGKGHGTEIMRRLTKMADETNTTMTLFPTPYGDGGLELEDLVAFYKKQGFEYLDPDPDIPDLDREMIRYPRKADGGIISMVDVARSTGRGPKGVASLAPRARNMFRPMVS